MKDFKELANVIFPNITTTIEDLEIRFPKRNLKEGAMVTRFAPSPTGFLHTGSLFTSLISYKLAKQSEGVFFVRLEDTDQKREVSGSGKELIKQLGKFGILPDEGITEFDVDKGNYGPYAQSKRASIYCTVIKYMIEHNLAYPCFCSNEKLDEIRQEQEKNKIRPGYYSEYAVCRNLTPQEAIERIKNNEPYVIRFKSNGLHINKIVVTDLVRGTLELSENDLDIVILKSDGLPTYHFAHLVDDHFMRTTHVSRGEEWLPSLPIHLELFKAMKWDVLNYAHLPVIMKLDNGNRRKLSKRKDEEAAVSYFLDLGYPIDGIIEYLLTIANSNYEEWRKENLDKSKYDFTLTFEKMSLDGALFDLDKVKNISKEYLSRLSANVIANQVYEWAKVYDRELQTLIELNYNYFVQIMNIEREKANPRKDYEKYSDVKNNIIYFYETYYELMIKDNLPFNDKISKDTIVEVLKAYKEIHNTDCLEEEWFNQLKELAPKFNFAANIKDYKKNPSLYLGHIGDFSEIIRVALTTKKQTPNLYFILKILTKDIVSKRIDKVISTLL